MRSQIRKGERRKERGGGGREGGGVICKRIGKERRVSGY